MFDVQAEIERLVADPTVQTPSVLYIRKLRSLAAKGSAGDGAVVATVNGYGALTRIRIAPEVMPDLPRLERLVKEAVNLATDEVERLRPPPPLPPTPFLDDDLTEMMPVTPSTPPAAETAGQPVVRNMKFGYGGYYPTDREPDRTVVRDAAAPIRMQIYRDGLSHPKELERLFWTVAFHLGNPRLTAAYARRVTQFDDPKVLRRFRRQAGVSLTEYIRRRQRQLAAKMYYRSGLPARDVARLLDFDGEAALVSAVGECDLAAFLDNAASIRSWIRRDSFRKPLEMRPILSEVEWNIHRPSLTVASVRRYLRRFEALDDPDILKRFRRAAGVSLTEYIRRRRAELAARMASTSDMPAGKIAEYLGFASGEALTHTVEHWAGCSLEELRDGWEDRGVDCVVWERVRSGEATKDDIEQFLYEWGRLYPDAVKRSRELFAETAETTD